MRVYDSPLCIVCSHLASGDAEGDEAKRNAGAAEILRRCTFPTDAQMAALGVTGARGEGGRAAAVAEGTRPTCLAIAVGACMLRWAARRKGKRKGDAARAPDLDFCRANPDSPAAVAAAAAAAAAAVGPPGHWGDASTITDHGNVIWVGDLNYRWVAG
jgi:hypothetical protein